MKRSLLILLLGCGQPQVTASTSVTSQTPALSQRVLTPFGYVDASCVSTVTNGASAAVVTHCVGKHYLTTDAETLNGWVEAAQTTTAQTPTYLAARWTVPPAPQTYDGGTIFFFPSFVTADSSAIVQPVLQYGASAAGGGAYWAIASWYVDSNGNSLHSDLLTVQPGDSILGEIVSSACDSKGGCTFTITATDETAGAARTFTLAQTVPYTSVQSAVLEAYGISDCSALPNNGGVSFTSVELQAAGNVPAWQGQVWNWDVECGFKVSETSSAATLAY